MKFGILIIVLVVALIIGGCKPKYAVGVIDEEATKQATAFWKSSLMQCGDSYYGVFAKNGNFPRQENLVITEIKEPSFITGHRMEGRTFSEADKLNKFEWQGTSAMFCKTSRWHKSGAWSDWVDGCFNLAANSIDVQKIGGKWEFNRESGDRYLTIPCHQIPQ